MSLDDAFERQQAAALPEQQSREQQAADYARQLQAWHDGLRRLEHELAHDIGRFIEAMTAAGAQPQSKITRRTLGLRLGAKSPCWAIWGENSSAERYGSHLQVLACGNGKLCVLALEDALVQIRT